MYSKVNYRDEDTVILAKNLNDMQNFDEALDQRITQVNNSTNTLRDKLDGLPSTVYSKTEVDSKIAAATPADYNKVKSQVETNKSDISTIQVTTNTVKEKLVAPTVEATSETRISYNTFSEEVEVPTMEEFLELKELVETLLSRTQ